MWADYGRINVEGDQREHQEKAKTILPKGCNDNSQVVGLQQFSKAMLPWIKVVTTGREKWLDVKYILKLDLEE